MATVHGDLQKGLLAVEGLHRHVGTSIDQQLGTIEMSFANGEMKWWYVPVLTVSRDWERYLASCAVVSRSPSRAALSVSQTSECRTLPVQSRLSLSNSRGLIRSMLLDHSFEPLAY